MERQSNFETEVDYEKVLRIEAKDVSVEKLKQPGLFRFAVTPEFNIFLSTEPHKDFLETYGVSLDSTLAEGVVKIGKNGTVDIRFKPRYQPVPGFKGSPEELVLLQKSVKSKILDFIK